MIESNDVKTQEPKARSVHALVEGASRVIAHYWPMTGFVHHNPIRGLEVDPFDEAVRTAKRFVGGEGYLPNEIYRGFVESGRILPEHIDAALEHRADDQALEFGGAQVTRRDVMGAHLLEGLTPPTHESLATLIHREPDSQSIRTLAKALPNARSDERSPETLGRDLDLTTWCDRRFGTQIRTLVDRELIKWCEAFLDEDHASWPMPERPKGFYGAWRALAVREWFTCGIARGRQKIADLPESPEAALLEHLDAVGIPEEHRQDYLSHELTALSGWASFVNWRDENPNYPWQVAHPVDLVQYLAVRLFYTRHLVNQTCQAELGLPSTFETIAEDTRVQEEAAAAGRKGTAPLANAWRLHRLSVALGRPTSGLGAEPVETLERLLSWLDAFPESDHGPVWLDALERGYQDGLLASLREGARALSSTEPPRPASQSIYCIDVRSEPFRRALESVGHHETLGFAGFFGIAIQARAHGQSHWTEQYPAIAAAAHQVVEIPRADQDEELARHSAGKDFLHTMQLLLHALKSNVVTPFIKVESLGWIFGAPLIGRTLFPAWYRRWRAKATRAIAPRVATLMAVDKTEDGHGMTSEEQAAAIEGALRTMGLTENFARLVLVCGHTSVTDNNPYESALDCGACGGNPGKPNARIFAHLANRPHVRKRLAENGIEIPDDTVFLAGLHDTTTDGIELFDLQDLPGSHVKDLSRFRVDLEIAKVKTNKERCGKLPGIQPDPSVREVHGEIERRAGDWSETRPEWGLSGNAAFIIGRRGLTKDLDLEGRAFLNSHDAALDPTGALLSGILNGPMVVGQWINAEHYFSATDPARYGSGSKVYHNVVGRIGVMSGPRSDLRTGLPWQSVYGSDPMPYHEPVRLMVVVEAPRDRVLDIVRQEPVLSQLCDNRWIHLIAMDPGDGHSMHRYEPKSGWERLES